MVFSKGGKGQGRGLLTGSWGIGSGLGTGARHLDDVVAVCSVLFSEQQGMGVATHLGCILVVSGRLLLSTGGQCGRCWWQELSSSGSSLGLLSGLLSAILYHPPPYITRLRWTPVDSTGLHWTPVIHPQE